MSREHRVTTSASRVSSRALIRPRRPGARTSAEQILELQRTAGNRAASVAIQRLNSDDPYYKSKDGLKPHAQGPKELAAVPSTVAAMLGQVGKKDSGTTPGGLHYDAHAYGANQAGITPVSDAGVGVGGFANGVGFVADLLSLPTVIEEFRKALKEAMEDKDAELPQSASRRKARVEGANVGFGIANVASGASKVAGTGVSAASAAGDIAGQAVSIAGTATGGFSLATSVASAIRENRKLGKQIARLRRLQKVMDDATWTGKVEAAQALVAQRDQALVDANNDVRAAEAGIAALDQAMAEAREAVSQLQLQSLRDPQRKYKQMAADREVQIANLAAAKQAAQNDLARCRVDVTRAQTERQKADQARQIMANEATVEGTAAAEAARPSLKAIGNFAVDKSKRGVAWKTAKVIASDLGVAAGALALAALITGPGALVLGPVAIALGGAAALGGLAVAGEKGKRFLAKRWARTADAYIQTGESTYGQTTRRRDRWKSFLDFRTKLYDDAEGQSERKSDRKVMAEALWDYATDDRYDESVHREAWVLIKALTKKDQVQLMGNNPHLSSEKAEQLKKRNTKLLEDKLKSL